MQIIAVIRRPLPTIYSLQQANERKIETWAKQFTILILKAYFLILILFCFVFVCLFFGRGRPYTDLRLSKLNFRRKASVTRKFMSRREAWLTSWNIRNPWIFSLMWSQPQDFLKTLHTRRGIWSCRDTWIAVWSVRDAMVFFSKIVRKSGSGTPLPSPPSLNKKI